MLDLNKTEDYETLGQQWHWRDNMDTICTLHQTGNHTKTSLLIFYGLGALSLMQNQQCGSNEGNVMSKVYKLI